MTQAEVSKLAKILSVEYKAEFTPERVKIWHSILSDIPYDVGQAAVLKILGSRVYPTMPQVGQVREEAIEIMRGGQPSPAEAWASVLYAVARFGYIAPSQAQQAVSDVTWRVLQAMGGWQSFCENEDPEGVRRGQFLKMFENQLEQDKSRMQLTPGVRKMIEATKQKAIKGGE